MKEELEGCCFVFHLALAKDPHRSSPLLFKQDPIEDFSRLLRLLSSISISIKRRKKVFK
jgi:hypothetical protein